MTPSFCFRVVLATAIALSSSSVWGQGRTISVVNPRAFGLNVPPGALRYSIDHTVEFRDDDGQKQVGRVHVAIGKYLVIEQPDGRLITRASEETRKSTERFKPIDNDDLEDIMVKKFPGFKTRSSRNFVFVYNTSQEFADVTVRILETMLPGVMGHAKRQRIDVHSPDVPLLVIMFATQQEFSDFGKLPADVQAYYSPIENYVVMYEKPKETPFKWEIYNRRAISIMAHEGAHQILANIGVQQRLSRWPMWLSEGIAEYYAPTSFGKRMRWKGAGDINDMRMLELESYLKSKDADQDDGEMVEKTVGAASLTSTGYASAWSLTHLLATRHRNEFNQLVKKVSETRPLEGALDVNPSGEVPSNKQVFEEFFGKDYGEIERELVQHLKRQPYDHPYKEFAHFVASVRISLNKRTYGTASVFHSQDLAMKWQSEQVQKLDASQQRQALVNLRIFPNRAAAVQYASQWMRANN